MKRKFNHGMRMNPASGIDPLHRIDKLINRFMYWDILEKNEFHYIEEMILQRNVFQQNKDPKLSRISQKIKVSVFSF